MPLLRVNTRRNNNCLCVRYLLTFVWCEVGNGKMACVSYAENSRGTVSRIFKHPSFVGSQGFELSRRVLSQRVNLNQNYSDFFLEFRTDWKKFLFFQKFNLFVRIIAKFLFKSGLQGLLICSSEISTRLNGLPVSEVRLRGSYAPLINRLGTFLKATSQSWSRCTSNKHFVNIFRGSFSPWPPRHWMYREKGNRTILKPFCLATDKQMGGCPLLFVNAGKT